MGTRITDETIETLRNVADIAQVVSDRVILKRSGRRLAGLCPFHVEKTPSFSVDPEKQMYHCFGCGAGGDVFSFVMQSEGLSFPDAVRSLADRFGVPLAEGRDESDPALGERQMLFDINRMVTGVFRYGLLKSSKGSIAREYLNKRGITEEFSEIFGLGFIPDGWSYLLDYMVKKGANTALLEKAGLVVCGRQGRFYDRFRNRIMFPIQDIQGRVIGFGGRVLGNDNPKYLNSPETPLYHKARSLYGLYQARHEIRKKRVVYVVEGYFDVISLHQNGIPETVAGLGTSLTREQVQLLRGYTERVVLVFDGDAAGLRAAERAAPLLLSFAMDARVLLLPSGEDPDSFVRSHGKEAFLQKGAEAEPLFSFLIQSSLQRWGRNPAGRMRSLESLLPVLENITDSVVRDLYLRELADGLDLEERAVRDRLGKQVLPRQGQDASREIKPVFSEHLPMEEALISLLLSVPQCRDRVAAMDAQDFFSDPVLKRMAVCLLNKEGAGTVLNSPEMLQDEEVQKRLARLGFQESVWNMENADNLISQFQRLQQQRQRGSGLMDRIKAAEAGRDQARLMALLEQKQQQAREAAKIGLSRVVTPRRHIQ
ncbi:DNA primase [Desulfobotulus alkaliphilus]|uniref:DNA primase n=1 Tax=Desulfobotulus alkaliphilus TaxID=622671 RepID=A0A562RE99_9BACT|nr:DNA primase [Desulfobotulus alkaliphilus]TWI67233.1 DNA primase [Desulfobotulus alkaliphilus]